jgi:hypothetical protein
MTTRQRQPTHVIKRTVLSMRIQTALGTRSDSWAFWTVGDGR